MINWEELQHNKQNDYWKPTVCRAKVPGGWLVALLYAEGSGFTFYPDPEHKWDGSYLP
jgi:hypothetical protein